jgi:hypothetical protein
MGFIEGRCLAGLPSIVLSFWALRLGESWSVKDLGVGFCLAEKSGKLSGFMNCLYIGIIASLRDKISVRRREKRAQLAENA